jgi:hypothetical protein
VVSTLQNHCNLQRGDTQDASDDLRDAVVKMLKSAIRFSHPTSQSGRIQITVDCYSVSRADELLELDTRPDAAA